MNDSVEGVPKKTKKVSSAQEEIKVTASKRQNVFISYSHKDAIYLEGLLSHLKYYERNNLIDYWADTKINPGENWREEIEKALASAKVAILLLSIDFLNSQFIADNELPRLLASAETEGVRILPVILRPCNLPESLSRFQAVNSPSTPLVKMKGYQKEEIWVKVANTIVHALNSQKSGGAAFSNPQIPLSKVTEGIRNVTDGAQEFRGHGQRVSPLFLLQKGLYKFSAKHVILLIVTALIVCLPNYINHVYNAKPGTWYQWLYILAIEWWNVLSVQWWNVLAVYTLLLLLWWAWRAKKRVVIMGKDDSSSG